MNGGEPTWILPDAVFDGVTLSDGLAVGVEAGQVVTIIAKQELDETTGLVRLAGTVAPGFVDLQVNGGNGVLFNATPTPAGIAEIAAAHRAFGTVKMLPTVITDAPDVMVRAVDAVLEIYPEHGILGIHIEGPHLSAAAKGAHAERFLRPMDDATFSQVKRLRDKSIPVLITVAPEAATGDDIARLCDLGAVVSIGHSAATAPDVRRALAAGARCFTHLFNAMSQMHGRAPGVVGAAINSQAHVGIICDGRHVSDEMVGLAIRGRPVADRMFLVSDAMPTVGGAAEFELYGEKVVLKGGRLHNQNGGLAGAHTTMLQSVGRLIGEVGVAAEMALRMATAIPHGLMRGQGDVAPMLVGCSVSDVVVLDKTFKSFEYLDDALGDQV